MQGRSDLEEMRQQVDALLESVASDDATLAPDVIYSSLITALNDLTKSSTLDKPQRALYRERLSVALSARIKKAINTKNKSALIEEKAGLAKVISEVAILQGSGGVFGLAAEKTTVQSMKGLIAALEEAIANPKIEQFRRAGLKGDSHGVEALLKEGFDVNYIDEMNRPLLHWALIVENIKCFDLLLKYNANPNQVNDDGNTPLHLIALIQRAESRNDNFCLAVFNELIKNNVNVNLKNKDGKTALFYALLGSPPDLAIQLIGVMVKKASPFAVGSDPTIYACLIEALNQADMFDEKNHRSHGNHFFEILSKLVDAFKNKLDVVIKAKNCTYSDKQKLLEAELCGLRAVLDEVRLLKNDLDISKVVVAALSGYIHQIEKHLEQVEVFDSVCQGDLKKLKDLSKRGIEINIQDEEGRRPIYSAIAFRRGDIARFLINQNADIFCQNKEGYTPLLSATWYGNEDLVRFLIDRNADINQADNHGNTPLYLAADRGCVDIAEVLIEKGVDYNQIRSWFENNLALYVPVWPPGYGIDPRKVGVAKLLLNTLVQKASLLADQAAQPATSPANETIYSLLIATLNHDELKPIYKNNKVFRGEIRTWLAEALTKKASTVVKGDPENIEAELKGLRAIINEVDLLKGASSLLHEKSAVTVIKQCIEKLEAELQQRKAVEVDPSKALLEAAEKGDLGKIKALIEKGVDINCQDEEGRTPFYIAAKEGHKEIVQLLLVNNAAVNQVIGHGYGSTPLSAAAYMGHKEVVQLLLENKAAVNQVSNYGATPLYFAAQSGYVEIVKLLLEKNADFNQRIIFGGTPIFIAAQNGHPDVVEALIQAGADINQWILLGEGKTPLDIAEYMGHNNVVQVIKNAQDKKIRSFMPGLSSRVDLQAGNYSELIRYLNDEEPKYSHSRSLRKMIRLSLIQALKERVEAVRFEGDAEIIQAELQGFKQIKNELRLIQKADYDMTDKRAMKKIDGLIKLLSNPQGRLADSQQALFSSNFDTDGNKQKPEPKGSAFAFFGDL